jgi:hypothetical protein
MQDAGALVQRANAEGLNVFGFKCTLYLTVGFCEPLRASQYNSIANVICPLEESILDTYTTQCVYTRRNLDCCSGVL